jgi:hypothetical protein
MPITLPPFRGTRVTVPRIGEDAGQEGLITWRRL